MIHENYIRDFYGYLHQRKCHPQKGQPVYLSRNLLTFGYVFPKKIHHPLPHIDPTRKKQFASFYIIFQYSDSNDIRTCQRELISYPNVLQQCLSSFLRRSKVFDSYRELHTPDKSDKCPKNSKCSTKIKTKKNTILAKITHFAEARMCTIRIEKFRTCQR